ncbi:uncharacterized protein A4U43_C07F38840 [Asparagus officinalis]|uniref:Uncharacterized protein n=1 Tax=Asparagus officinalis TaxID=4686 RepID=A0A5P1ELE5_ASPOF|nr:uncharacterized protein A4U43_C07F38840 [Asparagus officinalis]
MARKRSKKWLNRVCLLRLELAFGDGLDLDEGSDEGLQNYVPYFMPGSVESRSCLCFDVAELHFMPSYPGENFPEGMIFTSARVQLASP